MNIFKTLLELSGRCMLGVAAIGFLSLLGSPAKARERVVNIAMEDQFRNRRETGVMQGDVVVLVYAERKGSEAGQALGRKLHVQFHPTAEQATAADWSRQPVVGIPGWPAAIRVPDVHVVPVACLPEVPKPLQAVARSRFRTDSPAVSVWLDFDDTMRRTFGMVPAAPNVVLLDTHGQMYSMLSGHFDDVKYKDLVSMIDFLRRQAHPDLRTASTTIPIVR
ncbi:MAG: hypothetical protein DWI25_07275 [Planctomycetota bacterium]|nr:MAG: hypothetical protein DWI25_07275 [Planctomycetota bacterium]